MKYLTKYVKHMRFFQMKTKKNYMIHVEGKMKNSHIKHHLKDNKHNKRNNNSNSLGRDIKMMFFKILICFSIPN